MHGVLVTLLGAAEGSVLELSPTNTLDGLRACAAAAVGQAVANARPARLEPTMRCAPSNARLLWHSPIAAPVAFLSLESLLSLPPTNFA